MCGWVCEVLVQDCPDGMGCVYVVASAGYLSTCVTLADPGGIAAPCDTHAAEVVAVVVPVLPLEPAGLAGACAARASW